MKIVFTYTWVHLKSGDRGERTEEFLSRMDFLEKLNNWNRLGVGSWQYFESTS